MVALVIAGSVTVRGQQETTQVKVFVKVYERSSRDGRSRLITAPRVFTRMETDASITIGEGDRRIMGAKITPTPVDDEQFRLTIEFDYQSGGSKRSMKTVLLTQDGEPQWVGGLNVEIEGKTESLFLIVGATRVQN